MNRSTLHRRATTAAGALSPLAALALAAACAGAQAPATKVSKEGAAPAARGASAAGMGAAAATALPLKHAPRPTAAPITAADLMTRLYIFADDSMMGREAGTEGNAKGNAYIERELRRLGLRPAGENGTFYQNVPYVRRAWDAQATLAAGDETLRFGADFIPVAGAAPRSLDGATAVYGGQMTMGAYQGLTAEQAAGKVVVLSVQSAAMVRAVRGAQALQGAAGIALVILDQLPEQMRAGAGRPQLVFDSAGYANAGGPPQAGSAPLVLYVSQRAAQAMLGAPLDGMTAGTAGRTLRGNPTFTVERAKAANVVASIPGSDPKLRETYVALGSHNDHDGVLPRAQDHDSLKAFNDAARRAYIALDPKGNETLNAEQEQQYRQARQAIRVNVDSLRKLRAARPDSIMNGADDDGSGSMALLEIAENVAAMRVKPKRSMLFVWHTAEEKGLVGSRWYTDHPTVPRDSIVAQVNIDMIGRGRAADVGPGGPDYVGIVGSRRLSTGLGDMIDAMAKQDGIRLDYTLDADGHPQNIYCRSDHYMYARYGIPIAFFFTGLHGDYHQLTDEPQYIDYPHYARLTNFIRDVTVRVANQAERPVVDKPKPNPNGGCRQ